jgi:hypothetical protein
LRGTVVSLSLLKDPLIKQDFRCIEFIAEWVVLQEGDYFIAWEAEILFVVPL